MRLPQTSWSVLLTLMATAYTRETVYDAARIARELVDHSLDSVGSMATTFPPDDPRLPAQPFSLPEYYASCHQNGSLALLFLPISRHGRNILQKVDHMASLSVTSPNPLARNARVSLIGNVTIFNSTSSVPDLQHLQRCYLSKHPDAREWLPNDDEAAHVSYWARFDPHTIYFVGGFGDEHYIGYIPPPLYQTAGTPRATGLEEVNNHDGEQQIFDNTG